jgi:hypothetical protein
MERFETNEHKCVSSASYMKTAKPEVAFIFLSRFNGNMMDGPVSG